MELFPKGYHAPPDDKKTEDDWLIYERLMDFAQAAFNAHQHECSKYLAASEGGQQTSRDLHKICQGYALALRALAQEKDNG